MEKLIQIKLMRDAQDFIAKQEEDIAEKFAIAFRKTRLGFVGKWFKPLTSTDGLYEFKVKGKNNTCRLIAFWDKTGVEVTLIVCTHGFIKKTQKTPKKELKKASKLKQEYFNKS